MLDDLDALKRTLASPHPAESRAALEALTEHGALTDGSLRGIRLIAVDLSSAFLEQADFAGAEFIRADLREVYAFRANFSGARFDSCNLTGGYFDAADLRAVDLSNSHLQGAKLLTARADSQTRLPDSSAWTSPADWARFTDPAHPRFQTYKNNKRWYAVLRGRLATASARVQTGALDDLTLQALDDLYQTSGGRCHYCHAPLDPYGDNAWTLDHVIPLAAGGANTRQNVVIACRACNLAKRDMSYGQFLARQQAQARYNQPSLWDDTPG